MKKELIPCLIGLALFACGQHSDSSDPGKSSHDPSPHDESQPLVDGDTRVLSCDFLSIPAEKAPFWKVERSVFVALDPAAATPPSRLTSPSKYDLPPIDLGGHAPAYDTMYFCTTTEVSARNGHAYVEVVTKKVKSMDPRPCSQFTDKAVQMTYDSKFTLGHAVSFFYRQYDAQGASSTRKQLTYFAKGGEFPAGSGQEARDWCTHAAAGMDQAY